MVVVPEIPLWLLPLRADIYRYQNSTGDYDDLKIINLPCRLGLHSSMSGMTMEKISSAEEGQLFICRYEFNGSIVDIRYEDQIKIVSQGQEHWYRVSHPPVNSESANQHLEIQVEELSDMRTKS